MNQGKNNRLVLSVLPHSENITFDFSNWVYYFIFGFNIDFHKMFQPLGSIKNPTEEEYEDLICQIESQGKEFEKNILNMIREKSGSGIHISGSQLFSSDGDSLRSEISSRIDRKISYFRRTPNKVEFSEEIVPTRPIIFALPFTINALYNPIFNKPSGIGIFTKKYRDNDAKKVFFFVLNAALNTSSFDEFERFLVHGIAMKKKVSDLNIKKMNWEKLGTISDTLNTMCHSIFGSNQFSKNSSNLLKYGFSPTGSYLQLS